MLSGVIAVMHLKTSGLRKALPWFAAAALIALTGQAHAEDARLHTYEVEIDEALTTISVKACFDGHPPGELVAASLDAPLVLIDARVEGSRRSLQPSGSLSLRSMPDDGCLLYSANVSRPIRQHDRSDGKVRRLGNDLLTSAGLWLWRPAELAADEDVQIMFRLREGLSVSAPWEPMGKNAERAVFRLGHAPHDEPAYVAFGRFDEREIMIGDAHLRVAVLEGSPPADAAEMQDWLADAAALVSQLYGRFPVAQAQVLVVPDARGGEPTPWAHVVRGGAPAVHFFVNQRRPIGEFYDDWTAVHEFSHLLLPLVSRDDAWLYEGMATYYQNVLRARAGRITARDAWTLMDAGFRRGRGDSNGLTLAQATEGMYRSGAYMRVYWEGAALVLMADVRLRQMTGGKQSLDTALGTLNECCSSPERAWTARQLLERLDAITGTRIFEELYEQHVGSQAFPDLGPAYRALGISSAGGTLEFLGGGRETRLRNAIMGAGTPAGHDPEEEE